MGTNAILKNAKLFTRAILSEEDQTKIICDDSYYYDSIE